MTFSFDLVGGPTHALHVHHPWRLLRERFTEWRVIFEQLPPGRLGDTDPDTNTIRLTLGMPQCQRRTVIDHEMFHAEARDRGVQHPKRERAINEASARRLIPLGQLVDAWVWAYSVEEMADECFVDVQTMRRRIDFMTDGERAVVQAALAERDFHEEGM